MKFKVALTIFLNALNVALKTVGTETQGHQGIKIYASKKNNRVKISTTDGHHATEIWFDATVTNPGKAVIRAEKVKKYLDKLDVKDITLSTTDNGSIILRSSRGQQTFVTYGADAFPVIPKIEASNGFSLSGKVYRELVDSVAFCTKGESKGGAIDKLEGINIVSNGRILSMYTTDGISVAAAHKKVRCKEMNVILAKKSLVTSSKYVKDDEKVTIQGTESKYIVKIGDTTYHIPVLVGKFPALHTIIPKSKVDTEFTAERSEILGLLERSAVILDSKESIRGILQVQKNKIILEGKKEDADFNEHITVNGDGNNLNVKFDIKRLTEIIKNIDDEVIRIGIQPKQPIVVRPDSNNDHTCLLAIG